jgi:hypothetical protein
MTRRGHPRLASITTSRRVRLTRQAVGLIDGWRGPQGLTFSAALEALARLGLRQARPDAFHVPLEGTPRGARRGELARVADLLPPPGMERHPEREQPQERADDRPRRPEREPEG